MNPRPIEIFYGTGGVGKTTLSTARALSLASQGLNVLLITIDPAKRLKQILHMKEEQAGEIKTVQGKIFGEEIYKNCQFDALLANPANTLRRIVSPQRKFDNHILKTLTRPYGGMNEIMAIIEVQHHLSQGRYHTIVLDTPPGKHFVDFLLSTQKINRFFDKTFMEIFKYQTKGRGLLSLPLIKTGLQKLLSYLEKVTGPHFVGDFLETLVEIYRHKSSFMEALKFQERLKDGEKAHGFLVTSIEQQKFMEAFEIQKEAENLMPKGPKLAINKCLAPYLQQWEMVSTDTPLTPLRNSIQARENRTKDLAYQNFKEVLEFPEILATDPQEHIGQLAQHWAAL